MVHGASDRIRRLLCWRKVAGSALGVNKPFLKNNAYCVIYMGRLTGFEPATSGATIQRSNQLSYKRHAQVLYIKSHGKSQSALRGSLVDRKNLGSLG